MERLEREDLLVFLDRLDPVDPEVTAVSRDLPDRPEATDNLEMLDLAVPQVSFVLWSEPLLF